MASVVVIVVGDSDSGVDSGSCAGGRGPRGGGWELGVLARCGDGRGGDYVVMVVMVGDLLRSGICPVVCTSYFFLRYHPDPQGHHA